MKEFCVEVTRKYRVWIKAEDVVDVEEIVQSISEEEMDLDEYDCEVIDEREIEDDFLIYDDIDDEDIE